jgi:hypothetical protein
MIFFVNLSPISFALSLVPFPSLSLYFWGRRAHSCTLLPSFAVCLAKLPPFKATRNVWFYLWIFLLSPSPSITSLSLYLWGRRAHSCTIPPSFAVYLAKLPPFRAIKMYDFLFLLLPFPLFPSTSREGTLPPSLLFIWRNYLFLKDKIWFPLWIFLLSPALRYPFFFPLLCPSPSPFSFSFPLLLGSIPPSLLFIWRNNLLLKR